MALGGGPGSFGFRTDDHRSIGQLTPTFGPPKRPGPKGVTADNRERWRINPDRSTLEFRVGQQILRGLRGKFHCWGGQLLLDKGGQGLSAIRLWVDLSSFDTGSAKHDERIVAEELFDVQSEPAVVFDSERVQMTDPGHGVVEGRLAVHCVDRKAAASIEAAPPQRDESGVWHLVYNARISIALSALCRGRNKSRKGWLSNFVWGEVVQIVAHIEALRDTHLPIADSTLDTSVSMGFGVGNA
jgi:polyisoprenoid-binding protein YceI